VRMQHRSGAMWLLNSTALKALALEGGELPGGVERDGEGKLTGRIYYEDTWLRSKLGTSVVPDLAGVGKLLASYGVTGVTDATPDKGAEELAALAAAVARQDLRQRVVAMGRFDASPELGADISMGAVKIMLREPELPDFDALVAVIEQAHRAARGVAFHCVTRAELVTAAAALREAGTIKGDRIEHASVAPPELVELLAELSVTVVTQPGFIYERGDVYAKDVVPADRDWLYRGRGFLDNGVALGAGTDAPYGDADPWLAIRAAVTRTTREARVLGRDEGLSPERALALFTSPAADPGGLAPRVCVGMPADLCLVDLPWHQFRERLMSAHVRLTVCRGDVTWQRDDHR
jgi:predicted amidohydrolase YtcJ